MTENTTVECKHHNVYFVEQYGFDGKESYRRKVWKCCNCGVELLIDTKS